MGNEAGYVPTYCVRCCNLQFDARIGKACEFCGGTIFANVRPEPTLSQHDREVLKRKDVRPEKKQ